MPLWSNTDANTSAPKIVGVAGSSTTSGLALYANTTSGAFIAGQKVGIFGVDVTEQGLANNKTTHGAHSGWNLVKQGTGGRSGRIQVETLVAMGSMISTTDGSPSANDDTVFADA
jgi:hypothetical protein